MKKSSLYPRWLIWSLTGLVAVVGIVLVRPSDPRGVQPDLSILSGVDLADVIVGDESNSSFLDLVRRGARSSNPLRVDRGETSVIFLDKADDGETGDVVVHLSHSFFGTAELFYTDRDGRKERRRPISLSSERHEASPGFVAGQLSFSLTDLAPNTPVAILLRPKRAASVSPLVQTFEQFLEWRENQSLVEGIFTGIAILGGLLSLLVYFVTRGRGFLAFFAYALVFVVGSSHATNTAMELLPISLHGNSVAFGPAFRAIAAIVLVLFYRKFFTTGQLHQKTDRFLTKLTWVMSLAMPFVIFTRTSGYALAFESCALLLASTVGLAPIIRENLGLARKALVSALATHAAMQTVYLPWYLGVDGFAEPPPHFRGDMMLIQMCVIAILLAERTVKYRLEKERLGNEVDQRRAASAEAARLHGLGIMAAGIVHEIRNPLFSIRGALKVVLTALENPDVAVTTAAADVARVAENEAAQIEEIVRSLKLYTRNEKEDPVSPHALISILEGAVILARKRFEIAGVDLRIEIPDTSLVVDCRPGQIVQVLHNLISNAFDAVEKMKDPWVRIDVSTACPKGFVTIRCVDAGAGIPPDVAQKLTTPFFTTKEVGRGTGLGLSIARGIAESHGGRLELQPLEPNTTFSLLLPLSCRASDEGPVETPAAS